MRALSLCAGLVATLLATFVAASAAHAQTTDVVVGVPIEDGKAGKPQPGVIVDLEGKERRDRLPDPVIVHEVESPGKTTVRPKFGGGYTVEKEHGPTTTVQPSFGGGYTVETEGKSKTEVKPNFGGGYTIEKKDAGARDR
jgi:hypothetical protein